MYPKSYGDKADPEILRDVGRRLRTLRGDRSQDEAAALAGLSRQTVARAERGDNPTLSTVVRLLRVYGRLGALESFIPQPEVSPMALLRERQHPRRRSSTSARPKRRSPDG
jgi:transcriptional regulator with XRE-family HTH domain